MKIKFIGTGSGKTSLKRYHSSFLIDSGNYKLLVDAGDGISRALLSSGIEINSINAVLFSHMHPDHAAGLPSLIIQMKLLKRKEILDIYCYDIHEENIFSLLTSTHIYPERLEFTLVFHQFREGMLMDTGEGIKFRSFDNSHLNDLKKFFPGEDFASDGFLFYLGGKKIFYTGDVADEADLYTFDEEKPDIYIAECIHIEEEKIIEAFEKSGAEYLYLLHIPDEVSEKAYGDKIIYTFDGLEIQV